MKLALTRQNLYQGLTAVSQSVPARTTLPVLSNILFDATEDGLWITATDLDVTVRTRVPAEVQETGSLTVPGKKIQEIVRALPARPVLAGTLGSQMELVCGKSRFKLNGLPADDFPSSPQLDFDQAWTTSGADLLSLIRNTSFAVSSEESRPILSGVLWELRGNEMRMVATNGHRLARMSVKTETSGPAASNLIVPPSALRLVQRLFGEGDELELGRDGNFLGFRSGPTEVYTRLIDGTYPNYKQVIPRDNDKFAVVDKNSLLAAVKRMDVVASDQTHRIKLSFSGSRMNLSVSTPDLGEGYDEVDLGYEGDDLDIGFNASYLIEVLQHMPTDDVRLAFKAPERAATVEPVPAEDGDAIDYLCLVMPLRLLD